MKPSNCDLPIISRLSDSRPDSGYDQPQLTVIVPVYNEIATISRVVDSIRSLEMKVEIIAIDDGSEDGTGKIMQDLLAAGRLEVLIVHSGNMGKGAAIRSAIPHARGKAIVINDADLEYNAAELPRLYRLIESGKADAVYGSRLSGGEEHRVLYFWHFVGNKLVTLVSNMFTNLNLTDVETCYKMVTTPLMQSLRLRSNRFGIDPEITAQLARSKARIFEVSISYNGRTYAEGKKITWRDGVAALWHIVAFRFR